MKTVLCLLLLAAACGSDFYPPVDPDSGYIDAGFYTTTSSGGCTCADGSIGTPDVDPSDGWVVPYDADAGCFSYDSETARYKHC